MQRKLDALPPILLSWSGSESTYRKCDANISTAFANASLTWKKNGKTPLNINFPVKLVNYCDEVIFKPQDRAQDYGKFAFLHIYYISAATVDEYRSSVRHEVSEWFAALNLVDFTQWIIVFDSTRSKENKTRGQVLERIKSDFSKYINRLIEIYDGSGASMTSMLSTVLANVQTAVDCFATHQEATLLTNRNRYRNPTWSLVDYLNQHFMILRFYERLNILEHVLEQLDDMSKLVDMWLNLNSSGGKRPFWLESLACDPFRKNLYLLSHLVNMTRIPSELNIVELRCLIVSRQMCAVHQIFEAKLQSKVNDSGDMPTPSYRTDFGALLLRYCSNALDRITMNLRILEPKFRPERFHAWALLFISESIDSTLEICGELSDLENPHFLGTLLIARSASVYELRESVGSDILQVLEATKDKLTLEESSEIIDRVAEGLKDKSSYLELAEEDHELTERLLKQFHWKRHARFISAQLSRLHWNTDRAEESIPYLFKFISSVIADRKSIALVEELMTKIVHQMKKSEKYMDKIIDYTTLLMLHASDNEDRISYQKLLLTLLGDYEESFVIEKISDSPSAMERLQCPLQIVRAVVESPCISGIPGEIVQILLDVDSKFPASLNGSDVDIRLVFRPLTTSLLDELKANSGPVFECSYNRGEKVNRFACLTKGSFLSRKQQDITYNELDSSGVFVFEQMKVEKLHSGRNRIVLNGTAVNPGLYVVDRLELKLRKKSRYAVKWRSRNTLPVRSALPDILCAIQSKQPNVVLLEESEVLLAGAGQIICLEVSSGSTTTVIGGDSSDLKLWVDGESKLRFFDSDENKWANRATISIGKIEKETKQNVEVYLYLPIDDRFKEADTVAQQIEVEWMSLRWSLDVAFEPLIKVISKTSLLEESRLVELQLIRPYGIGTTFNVIPESATLDSATLLNQSICDDTVVPNSTYCICFSIPSNAPASCVAQFTYRIEGKSERREAAQSRSFSLEDTVFVAQEKAEYELCAQLCSEQPKAVLLRTGSPCNLVVSLRSLSHRVETVVIALESDDKYWQIEQKYKLLFVKESGLGQTSFTIVPKMIGFLPYPGIFVHSCSAQPTDSSQVIGEQTDFGARRCAFLRTSGRQVHVLGSFGQSKLSTSESSSLDLPKLSLRSSAKQRLQKLLA